LWVFSQLARQSLVVGWASRCVQRGLPASRSRQRQAYVAALSATPFRRDAARHMASRERRRAGLAAFVGDLSWPCSLLRHRLLRDGHGGPAWHCGRPRIRRWRRLMSAQLTLAPLLESFFRNRLTRQRNASPSTIASYRDALRMLVLFVAESTRRKPCTLSIADFDRDLVLAFLDELQEKRMNTIQTRNARLTAIRSFFHHVAANDPASSGIAQRILAIPLKRPNVEVTHHLSRDEVDTLIGAPDQQTPR